MYLFGATVFEFAFDRLRQQNDIVKLPTLVVTCAARAGAILGNAALSAATGEVATS